MFDLPNAKRVRRDELLSRTSTSPSPSPPPESSLSNAQQRLSELLNIDSLLAPTTYPDPSSQQDNTENPEDEEQEFEFRLFSAPVPTNTKKEDTKSATNDASAQKLRIRVRSPTPGATGPEDGRFVKPFRGWDYYFSAPGLMSGTSGGELGEEEERLRAKRREFESVAVSGAQMVGFAGVSWPGCHLPWRVVTLKTQQKGKKGSGVVEEATTCVRDSVERAPTSLKKPGKKRRIQLRKKVTAAEAKKKKEEEAKLLEAEKRNRKNRERKIKRRQKAREQKAAAAAAAGEDALAAEMDVDGSSDEGSD
ncbi:hypothetical protein BO94DRAFT_557605 [Aspergillus sclerotioniger CBS 115572]|uniref:Uncharacterized protein n=1 Tax=Aspergillus sclerotioniger CBS 115572 TaxID=1450535 RepID=A0A317WEV5_9EURO|nr:hypothetical protein BO94DRAFT_557605 [Aspergillus sclerotioniger CBS 115572]PWY83752.1 hypothetical protein BO94DRAFT_557605 [Aspergillus sclerotioniger CBS 115572]